MKKNYLFVVFSVLLATFCVAQTNVQLQINHKLGDSDFGLNVASTNDLGNDFNVNRLQYYISQIQLKHDDGMITDVPNFWALVNASENTLIDLGNYDITNLQQIQFYIGVEPDVNHDDPALFEQGHPLAPQNPSMHWGWASGYRFIAMEGMASDGLNQVFEIHGLGDDNYLNYRGPFNLDAVDNNMIIELNADYNMALKGIDVGGGLISHGFTGPSLTILENFKNAVFTPANSVVNNEEVDLIQNFDISPNPSAEGYAVLNLQLKESGNYQVHVFDLMGHRIQTIDAGGIQNNFDLKSSHSGVYLVSLMKDGKVVQTKKWRVE